MSIVARLVWAAAICAILAAGAARADESASPALSQAELAEATTQLTAWAEAYRAGDYMAQWRLTDPRIRHWFGPQRWQKKMRDAKWHHGELLGYAITAVAPVTARQLPCTEQRHCYRRGVRYVFFSLRTTYGKAPPPQPEYAVMAWSDEGWRFGGGTFPNRPLGETAVIMTELDELRYQQDLSILRQ